MSKIKTLAITAAAAITLAGCHLGTSGAYYDTLCVDPATQIRVDPALCYTNPAWVYYVPYGYSYPSLGGHITNYTINNYRRPKSATIHTGTLPATGGKAQRFKSGNTTIKPPAAPKPKTGGGVNMFKAPAPRPMPRPAKPF